MRVDYYLKYTLVFYFDLKKLNPNIIGGRIVQKLTVIGKTRSVAWTVPGVLVFVVFQSASEMRTAWFCWGYKIYNRLKTVDKQLRVENTP